MKWWMIGIVAGSIASSPAFTQPSHEPIAADAISDNEEMKRIFDADQAARSAGMDINWEKVSADDARRRVETKALLDAGALRTGEDYERAAFVFQHGGTPEDYLLAHSLAIVAVARGRQEATWIAAATLDRYLQDIGQKQIFGTQYSWGEGFAVTQEPYDPQLVSDSLRSALNVPARDKQEERRTAMEAERAKSGGR